MFKKREYIKGAGFVDITVTGLTVNAVWREIKMSDYWINGTEYTYWAGDGFRTYFIEDVSPKDDDVDAPEGLIALWRKTRYEDARAKRHRVDMDNMITWARRYATPYLKAPKIGDWVVVARGRKVPKGTQGLLFWTRDYDHGMRAGLYVAGQKDPVFVAYNNLDLVPVAPEQLRRQVVAEHRPRVSR